MSNFERLEIDDDRSYNHRKVVEKIMERVKKPHNYGSTPEEQESVKRKEITEKEKRDREEKEERERDEQEAAAERMRKQKEWSNKLEQIKRDELQLLDVQAAPLRNYLMAHVMPTLTKALIGKLMRINRIVNINIRLFFLRMLSNST